MWYNINVILLIFRDKVVDINGKHWLIFNLYDIVINITINKKRVLKRWWHLERWGWCDNDIPSARSLTYWWRRV